MNEPLEINQLSVKYSANDKYALQNIDLKLNRGQKVVLLGPNGSGKSTLFRAILGLVPFSKGSISVYGKNVNSISNELRVSTNLIEIYKIAFLKTRKIVEAYADIKGSGTFQPFKTIDDFGVGEILNKRIEQLSTGQQKILGDILSVCFEPNFILLDEPFDNVDQSRRRRFVELLKTQGKDVTVMMSTHELDLLKGFSDWDLFFIIEGRIWGKFSVSQLDRLYLTRGQNKKWTTLAVIKTRQGTFSVTSDNGNIPLSTATNLEKVFEEVAS